jgi:UDPglucose 6-dehydrogenase
MTVGVVGNGFVGNAVYQNFKDSEITKVFDVNPQRTLNTLEEVLECKYIFVCLPTPMLPDGRCDLSYIENFFKDIPVTYPSEKSLYIIKSTVPIGTTDKLCNLRKDLKIVHNPEFLTAVNAVEDFKSSDRNIIGGKQEWCFELAEFYRKNFDYIPIQIVKSKESETIKYFANSFLASKVAFFNNLHEICQKFELNFDSVKDGICSDSRIGHAHTKVPGPDGHFGFGGYCFPKDINALIDTMEEHGIDASLFNAVWEYNVKVRGEK